MDCHSSPFSCDGVVGLAANSDLPATTLPGNKRGQQEKLARLLTYSGDAIRPLARSIRFLSAQGHFGLSNLDSFARSFLGCRLPFKGIVN
jgi:hypothetical protein